MSRPSSRRLIVNADDYALAEGVSRGILRAHAEGVVTSTSILAVGSAFRETVGRLRDFPNLGTGAHLAAVGVDPPLLGAREIPSLVDRGGRLARSWKGFLPRAALGRIDPEDLYREFRAQIRALLDAGLTLTHLDTHQHLHLWPMVRNVVFRLAAEFGIPAIRLPRSHGRRATGLLVNRLARGLSDGIAAAGLRAPDDFAGFDEAGRMTGEVLVAAVGRLAAGGGEVCELGTHPGEKDDAAAARYAWGHGWEAELAALVSDAARAAIEEGGFELVNFAAIHPGTA